jgi:hypothetical protein
MPLAVHRLTLHLVSAVPDAPPARVEALRSRLRAEGWLSDDARPGPRPLVAGGFDRARVETFDAPRFLSNWQGGFRVRCPNNGESAVDAFSAALAAWRAGGPRAMACGCGATHDLAALRYAPEAAFARGWLALLDAADAEVHPEALALAGDVLGGVRVIGRRG